MFESGALRLLGSQKLAIPWIEQCAHILFFGKFKVHVYMEKGNTGKSSDFKERGGNYVLIKDEEDPRLVMFEKPLPCCGCGIGWSSLLLGFVCPLIWYFAAILYLSKYYNKDPRERSGLAASAIAALVCTVITGITVAVIFL